MGGHGWVKVFYSFLTSNYFHFCRNLSIHIFEVLTYLSVKCVVHPSHKLRWGLVTPFYICSSIWSLNLRRATRTSLTFFSTISETKKNHTNKVF